MLSNTYRMSDAYDAANAKVDAENRYLWRMNRMRLDAEEMRDAMLACAGTLNLKMGGAPVIPPLAPDEVNALGDVSQWPVTLDPAESLRRSVYMYVKRSFPLTDARHVRCAGHQLSCSRRDVTNVAPQALALMNNEFVAARAREFAGRLQKIGGDNADGVGCSGMADRAGAARHRLRSARRRSPCWTRRTRTGALARFLSRCCLT